MSTQMTNICLLSSLIILLAALVGPVWSQDGKVDRQLICMDFPEREYIEKNVLGIPMVGFSWCESDNAIRFPTPLNIDLPPSIATSWKCIMGKNKTESPDDLCYVQDLALQELNNATLLSWNNASRREDMRIGMFVLRAGQVVLYETTTATVLHLVNFSTRQTIRKIGTVRYSPRRFFSLMTTLYEQFIVAFDSDRVDGPIQPLKIDRYSERRFAIRTSRLFAPGKPLDDLSQGNISMPVRPPMSPPAAAPTQPPAQPPVENPVSVPVAEPVTEPISEPAAQPVAESPSAVDASGSESPSVTLERRATSYSVENTPTLHNDSIYLIDLVIHLPTRKSKFLISRLRPVLRDDDTVESISIPDGGLFAMELDLDGVEESVTPSMQITQQPAFKSYENLTKYRPLVLINDKQRVHIFQLERGLMSGSFNWTDDQGPSAFYQVQNPDHYISATNMFVEAIPRFSGNFFEGSPMWLVVSLTSRSLGNSSVHFIALPEMQVEFEKDTRFDDPAQLSGTPGAGCRKVMEYFDRMTSSCKPRMQLWHRLNATQAPNTIVTRAVERFVTDVYLPQPLSSAVNIWPLEKPAHSAVFVLSDRRLEVFGLAPIAFTQSDVGFQKMSEFSFVGTVKDLVVSPNGLHVFANVFRHRWELESMNRFVDICEKLADPNTSELDRRFLEPAFRKPCEGYYRRPSVNDFVAYVGMCPVIGVQCYSFYRTLIAKVQPGYYTANAFEQLECPPGYFCPGGIKQKCPPGFICRDIKNIKPKKCNVIDGRNDESCFQDGLDEPIKCPEGASCIAPFLPPLPASPGHYISSNASRQILPCAEGEYCILGRGESEDRRCPGNFVCNSTSVVVPELCQCSISNCSYCPAGTFIELPCPVGHYCRPSNTSVECQPPMYCPEGTSAPELCPAGFYCPSPAEKIICPSGYFCSIGSISPSRCSVFAVCNEGSKDHAANFIVLVVGGIVLIAVVVSWKVSGRIIQKKRDRTLAEAQERASEKRRRISNLSQATQHEDDQESESEDVLQPQEDLDLSPLLRVSGPSNYVIDISFDHLGLVLPSGKAVLNGVTGEIRSSRVTAVMGPSGAGKTTFMTTLAGKAHYGKTVGEIFINGQKGKISKIKSLTGFVPQEDIMLRELTVRELLEFNASLRLPASTTAEERANRVETVLDVLGLAHLQYSIIGDETKRGISGGQRKRVNIGMELVAAPRILFLDEPTSGLDSTSSMEVCGMLRDVARKEKIPIVTVIHQPRYDIFTMFDDVLLLGPGGTTVYLGPSQLALSYFEMLGFKAPSTANPADFFMDVISGSVPREGHPEFKREDLFVLWKRYRAKFAAMTGAYLPGSEPSSLNSSLLEESDGEVFEPPASAPESRHNSLRNLSQSGSIQLDDISDSSRHSSFSLPKTARRKRTNVFKQFWLFLIRALLQQTRNIPGILADIVLVLLSAVTFGFVFFDSQYMGPPPAEVCASMPVEGLRLRCSLPILDPFPHMSIMTAIGLALPAAMAALRVFGPERVVFWRESSAGSNTFAYFLGKDLAHFPSLIILPLLFSGVFATFWSPRGSFVMIWLLFMLVWWVATGIGYVISVALPPNLATMGSVVVIFGFSMFAGIKPTLKEMANMWIPMPWLPWISPFRYSSEAFYLLEIAEWASVYDVSTGLNIMGYEPSHKYWWLLVLGGMGLFWRLLAMIGLELLDRKKRQ